MTADQYEASAGAGDPGSWNRYAYVQGDPVNRVDPSGQISCPAEYGFDACVSNGFISQPGLGTDPVDWCVDIANRFGNTALGFLQTTSCGTWMTPGSPLLMLAMMNPPQEDSKKKIAHHLKIGKGAFGAPGDCYNVPSRGPVTREIRYELYDEDDQRLAVGVISEHLTGNGMPVFGNSSSSRTANGVYTDTISLLGRSEPWQLNQTFSVTVAGTATVQGGHFSLEVWAFGGRYRDFGPVYSGCFGSYKW